MQFLSRMKLFCVFLIGIVVESAGPTRSRPKEIEEVAWRLRTGQRSESDWPETKFYVRGYEDGRGTSGESDQESGLSAQETERVVLELLAKYPHWNVERIAQKFSQMHPHEKMNKDKVVRIRQRAQTRTVAGRVDVGNEARPWSGLSMAQREVLRKRLFEITSEEVKMNGGRHADSGVVKGRVQARFYEEFNLYAPTYQMDIAFSNARSIA